jgi:Glycosyltransferase
VLLVPSLWAEARSRIVVEAMLRGVPVIASDTGGIPEAKMGVDYLIPVRPIENYQERVDEHMVPIADVPPQDIDPWEAALTRLITDPDHYTKIASESRAAALHYAENLSVRPFESF